MELKELRYFKSNLPPTVTGLTTRLLICSPLMDFQLFLFLFPSSLLCPGFPSSLPQLYSLIFLLSFITIHSSTIPVVELFFFSPASCISFSWLFPLPRFLSCPFHPFLLLLLSPLHPRIHAGLILTLHIFVSSRNTCSLHLCFLFLLLILWLFPLPAACMLSLLERHRQRRSHTLRNPLTTLVPVVRGWTTLFWIHFDNELSQSPLQSIKS